MNSMNSIHIPLKVPEKYLHYALTDYEIGQMNHDAVFIPYDQIRYFKDINQLFGGKRKAIILYLFETNSGHYTCLFRRGHKHSEVLSYFNSYGKEPDDDVLKLPLEKRIEFNEVEPHLFELMASTGIPCEYNNVRMQSRGTATCGWHVTHRLHYSHLTPEDYIKEMSAACQYYRCFADAIVVNSLLPQLLHVKSE